MKWSSIQLIILTFFVHVIKLLNGLIAEISLHALCKGDAITCDCNKLYIFSVLKFDRCLNAGFISRY